MKSVISILFIAMLLVGCRKNTTWKNGITKIEIATTGCLRGCPVTIVSIDTSLTLNYFGGYNAKLKGYYSGKVTRRFWDSLNMNLERMNYKQLDTTEDVAIDGEVAEII